MQDSCLKKEIITDKKYITIKEYYYLKYEKKSPESFINPNEIDKEKIIIIEQADMMIDSVIINNIIDPEIDLEAFKDYHVDIIL